ncbi:MAG: recombinase family protein [Clostridiales bacterium]|nr:recombinase family protein [Clostridiales bacterium]
MSDKYRVAMYIRVACANQAEVNSQKCKLTDYAHQHNMDVGGVYTDNGESGLSLGRPALARLLADVKAGGVKTVLVKDLCRLSRNFEDMTRLTDDIFPKYGVRVVAVNDRHDSANNESQFFGSEELRRVFAGFHHENRNRRRQRQRLR